MSAKNQSAADNGYTRWPFFMQWRQNSLFLLPSALLPKSTSLRIGIPHALQLVFSVHSFSEGPQGEQGDFFPVHGDMKIPLFYEVMIWRREWDSNPRSRSLEITVFKTAAFDHSAISPHNLFLVYVSNLGTQLYCMTCAVDGNLPSVVKK